MTSLIQVVDGVPPRGVEASRLKPLRTVRATVDWPLPSENSEDRVRPEIVAALSRALAACGSVAFRYDDHLPGAAISIPRAPRSVVNRLLDVVGLGGHAFGLAVASDPGVVAALFAYGGWYFAVQVALVFDPEIDPAPILDLLRGDRSWRGRPLPDGVRLLFGPGHDGDFAVVAAADRAWLERFKSALV